MRTLTTEEWNLLVEVQNYVSPKSEITETEKKKLKIARRILGKDETQQNTIN